MNTAFSTTPLLLFTAIATGAAIGGAIRFLLAEAAARRFGSKLPGTLAANMIACFIAGVAFAVWPQGTSASGGAIGYAAVMVGLAGGTSTWSTLAGEVGQRLSQHFWRAFAYLVLTLIGGAACAFAGVNLPPILGF
nr:CrcB family protein [Corynebacterium lactis]